MRPILLFALASVAVAQPAELLVDRVAVVIGKKIVTESEVVENLRIAEMINGEPLDLGAARRKEEAERMVDQELLRTEMQLITFSQPSASEAESVLRQFIGSRYPTQAAYQAALEKYGVSNEELKQQLVWQLSLIRFTEQRFRPLAAAPDTGIENADRMRPGASPPAPEAAVNSVDQQMDAFLKEARSNTKIILKPDAFR
jgi:hypothetical protein